MADLGLCHLLSIEFNTNLSSLKERRTWCPFAIWFSLAGFGTLNKKNTTYYSDPGMFSFNSPIIHLKEMFTNSL